MSQDLVSRLNDATDALVDLPPRELTAVLAGEGPTDAGTGGQFFTTLDALNHEVRWFAEHGFPMLIRSCADGRFSLEQVKWLTATAIGARMDFASWLGFDEFAAFTREASERVAHAESKEEAGPILIALERYTHRTQFWTTFLFPWGVGAAFPIDGPLTWVGLMDQVLRDPHRGPPELADEAWHETLARINAATQHAEQEEPADHRRLRLSISPYGAGSYGQSFSTFDYVAQEMRWICEQALPLVVRACGNDLFSVSDVVALAQPLISPPLPFLHWMGLDTYPQLGWRTLKAMHDIDRKEDLRTLFVALTRYAHRLQGWLAFYFPHGAGALFPRRTHQTSLTLAVDARG